MRRNDPNIMFIEFMFIVVILVSLFFGYWIGRNQAIQEADCINTLINVEPTWDGKKWNHSPVIRCLKPGEKK